MPDDDSDPFWRWVMHPRNFLGLIVSNTLLVAGTLWITSPLDDRMGDAAGFEGLGLLLIMGAVLVVNIIAAGIVIHFYCKRAWVAFGVGMILPTIYLIFAFIRVQSFLQSH
ncbi:MAG: hypothetical protein WD768_15605 [Phycisphaeraceae bacterium]